MACSVEQSVQEDKKQGKKKECDDVRQQQHNEGNRWQEFSSSSSRRAKPPSQCSPDEASEVVEVSQQQEEVGFSQRSSTPDSSHCPSSISRFRATKHGRRQYVRARPYAPRCHATVLLLSARRVLVSRPGALRKRRDGPPNCRRRRRRLLLFGTSDFCRTTTSHLARNDNDNGQGAAARKRRVGIVVNCYAPLGIGKSDYSEPTVGTAEKEYFEPGAEVVGKGCSTEREKAAFSAPVAESVDDDRYSTYGGKTFSTDTIEAHGSGNDITGAPRQTHAVKNFSTAISKIPKTRYPTDTPPDSEKSASVASPTAGIVESSRDAISSTDNTSDDVVVDSDSTCGIVAAIKGIASGTAGTSNGVTDSDTTVVECSANNGGGGSDNSTRGKCEAEGSLCEIVRGFERLLDARSRRRPPASFFTMKTKSITMPDRREEGGKKPEAREERLERRERTEGKKVDESHDSNEASDEKYDEFDAIKMPVIVRGLSKSPQSDEGIESDSERRRGSVARCWSLDSTVPSDDDTTVTTSANSVGNNGNSGLGTHQKRHKLRVTRCYSSDSAVLSDEDQVKGWESVNAGDSGECELSEGRPRYWRTPSVVVSDYSDYSYFDEKLERSDLDLEKYEGTSDSQSPSQASSCSCLDCDQIRESLDSQFLQVCRHRRHSDSCCLCLGSTNASVIRDLNEPGNRRNSCLDSSSLYYTKFDDQELNYTGNDPLDFRDKTKTEYLDVPPARKISDCSTISSLSGDECDVNELQTLKPAQTSGWRKLRNIVHWTPFFQTYKKQRYPWVQLAGHQGDFRAGPTPGTILKKLCPQEEACFRLLMNDVLRPYVPEFKGVLDVREADEAVRENDLEKQENDEDVKKKTTIVTSYLQLQDLLGDFEHPCVMDCKVGVRTYLESELAKAKERPKLRKDMYEKMVQVDPTAPSAEERRVQGVTKPRYMVWRETISSTATLGFRVEGIKLAHGGSSKDFKTTRTREQVTEALRRFVDGYPHAVPKYLQRLKAIRASLKASPFFASHEVVGSSLLFVHDAKNAGVWMIDFAKTLPLPQHLPRIRHDAEWHVGNHEDGYLIGVNNLIDIFQDIRNSEA